MRKLVALVAGLLALLGSAFAAFKFFKKEPPKPNWTRETDVVNEATRRAQAEAELAEAKTNEEISHAVIDNHPGSVVSRWNAGGFGASGSDESEPRE